MAKSENLKLKRNSAFVKMNKIRLNLFSFEQNELNKKQNKWNDYCFSFSTKLVDEKKEKEKEKPKTSNINQESVKKLPLKNNTNLNDSSCDDTEENENSSDVSCDEEEI